MPWDIQRDGSALHVRLTPSLAGAWEAIFDDVQSRLGHPRPLAIYLPAQVENATTTDADMLRLLWEALQSVGIPIFREK